MPPHRPTTAAAHSTQSTNEALDETFGQEPPSDKTPKEELPPDESAGEEELTSDQHQDLEGGAESQVASAAIGLAPGPRRGLPPSTGGDLYARASWLWGQVWNYNERHDIIASRWSVLDIWARLTLALVASLSAITLLQDDSQLALVFALTTAVFSAVNAALDPATRSRNNRAASRSFRHAERSAGQLLGAVQAKRGTVYVGSPEDGYYAQRELSAAELQEYGDRLVALEAEVDEILDKAPPINRLRTSRSRYPHTRRGLERLKKRLALQQEVQDVLDSQSASI